MILVHDDVLEDPIEYRSWILEGEAKEVNGFKGIYEADAELPTWIFQHYPTLKPKLCFARQSPFNQEEPNYIHTDVDMGDWTGILYLNPEPQVGDGTSFWRRRSDWTVAGGELLGDDGKDMDLWDCWYWVPARFNRLVLFPAPYYHSRSIYENYGEGDESRLIQVVFGELVDPSRLKS